MEDKFFRVESESSGSYRKWTVIRTKHPTRSNYILGEFYDRGAVQLFIEALKEKGFKEEM